MDLSIIHRRNGSAGKTFKYYKHLLVVSMVLKQTLNQQGLESRRVEYDSRTEYMLDFGPAADVSVDIVGDTALLVVDGEQYDIDLEENAQVFMNNGIVTFEVKA